MLLHFKFSWVIDASLWKPEQGSAYRLDGRSGVVVASLLRSVFDEVAPDDEFASPPLLLLVLLD
ncbi:MAG TPA: hypothetical protein VN496_16500 [Burkholderiales bacterium]|nr:hypothetical protein [Burkholderiales bacterium]